MFLSVGLDFHGVIDTFPEKFSALSHAIYQQGGVVHIVTGLKKDEWVISELKRYDIQYDHYFSIVDYLEVLGVEIEWRDGLPFAKPNMWDGAKAIYCQLNGIDMMFDDSDIYKPTFDDVDTTYMHVVNPNRKIYGVRK